MSTLVFVGQPSGKRWSPRSKLLTATLVLTTPPMLTTLLVLTRLLVLAAIPGRGQTRVIGTEQATVGPERKFTRALEPSESGPCSVTASDRP